MRPLSVAMTFSFASRSWFVMVAIIPPVSWTLQLLAARRGPRAGARMSIARPGPNVVPKPFCAYYTHARLARVPLSARRHLGRRRRQLRDLLRARHARRALPLRLARRRSRVGDDPAGRAHRHGVARLPAGRASRVSSTATVFTDPYDPHQGHRFNPHKLVMDPYAKVVGRAVRWDESLFGFRSGEDDTTFDERDSAPYAPLAAVDRHARSPGADDRPLRTPWHETLIYELHVKGFTKLNPHVPEAAARHLSRARVGAGDPAPDIARRHGRRADAGAPSRWTTGTSCKRGLKNYWGYNTLSYFAPDVRYATSPSPHGRGARVQDDGARAARRRSRSHPRRRLQPHAPKAITSGRRCRCAASTTRRTTGCSRTQPRFYQDFTGCGNTLNMRSPRVLQLIMDSLRYWVQEMHVDGFRFDLASALARELHAVDKLGAFFDIIHQDPVLSQVKLIAEPWDLGEGGYQVGNFPIEVDRVERQVPRRGAPLLARRRRRRVRARDAAVGQQRPLRAERPPSVREHQLHHRARRLHARRSGQLQREAQRGERRGQRRRREPQSELELRRRRADRPIGASWSCASGSGATCMATLMLSVGVPMISGGDELGRTQRGNNNAYCQDNEISWTSWELHARAPGLPRLHAPADPHLEGPPGAAPAQVLPGPPHPRRGRARTSRGSIRPGAR